jgi:hypothetical protein
LLEATGVVAALLVALFELDLGFMSLILALILSLVPPQGNKDDRRGEPVGRPLGRRGAHLCEPPGTPSRTWGTRCRFLEPSSGGPNAVLVGGIISAFASSTAILGATIPPAIPFLREGTVGAIAVIAALSVFSWSWT